MNFSPSILQQFKSIDNVLSKLKQPGILSNHFFNLDENIDSDFAKIFFKKINCVQFDITLTNQELTINIDKVQEAYNVNYFHFLENRSEFEDFLETLLTSEVHVEYCGSNYTKLIFLQTGLVVKNIKFITGLYIRLGCKINRYTSCFIQ